MSRREAGNLLLAAFVGLVVVALTVMTWRGFDGLLLALCGLGLAMGLFGFWRSRQEP